MENLRRENAAEDSAKANAEAELTKVEKNIRSIIEAIKEGIRTDSMAGELKYLDARKAELKKEIKEARKNPVRLHPNLAEVYREKVENLRSALNHIETRDEAASILRGLIDQIRLEPSEKGLQIDLVGELAGILSFSAKKSPGSKRKAGAIPTLVAGVGFEPTTFRL